MTCSKELSDLVKIRQQTASYYWRTDGHSGGAACAQQRWKSEPQPPARAGAARGRGLGGTVRHAGLALADGVCGTGAGNWARTCPGGSWPRAGPAEPWAAALPSREMQRGGCSWNPSERSSTRRVATTQPGSPSAAALKERTICSAEKLSFEKETITCSCSHGTGRTNPVSGSALGQAACPEHPPLQSWAKLLGRHKGRTRGAL